MDNSVTKTLYMKSTVFFIAILTSTVFTGLQAQTEIPKGFSKGSLTLPGNVVVNGYVKNNMGCDASVILLAETGIKKRYAGAELVSAMIDSNRFICIKGDFFRVLCDGELNFLQKLSDASAKAAYNGNELLFMNGTEGKLNDYFFYDKNQQQLQLLTKRNMAAVVNGTFNNCIAAIDKVKETGSDIARLGQAVEIYNKRSGK
jgi:hypothetical protein